MTNDEHRIAIAEACGWKPAPCSEGVWRSPNNTHHDKVPDYFSDLNAMHEAEKMLTQGQTTRYIYHLQTLCGGQQFGANYFVTAAQRAEAFLRTIGRWKDNAELRLPDNGHEYGCDCTSCMSCRPWTY